jgi:hypothetical protein
MSEMREPQSASDDSAIHGDYLEEELIRITFRPMLRGTRAGADNQIDGGL